MPEPVIEEGVKLVVHPLGEEAESDTEPVKPPTAVTVIVDVPEDPLLIVKEAGDAEIEKLGVVTVTVTVVVWIGAPLVSLPVKVIE